MKRRETSREERELFERSYAETRPLAKAKTKASAPNAGGRAIRPGGLDGHTAERLRRGLVEPQARIDLHGMTENVAHAALLGFLRNAHARGLRLVLVVTGRGGLKREGILGATDGAHGALKQAVPRWLAEPQFAGFVAASTISHRNHGGEGALYVYLRKVRR